MEVNGELHAPAALPLGMEPQYPLDSKAGWALELIWTQW